MRTTRFESQRPLRRAATAVVLFLGTMLAGCFDGSGGGSDRDDVSTGAFIDSPVAGLRFVTDSREGVTDKEGRFRYRPGETVAFYLGDLELGSAEGAEQLSPLDLVEGAADVIDPAVTNLAVLLQTLDADGDLNNGIDISEAIAGAVSGYASRLVFDQPPADFALVLGELLDELNAAAEPVFSDTDPRPRTLIAAADAQAHLARSIGPRKVVETRYGKVNGFAADDDTWAWYGIPYASPPINELRWKPPVAPQSWEGVRQATAWANQSAQAPFYEAFGEGGMSEDSLYLNVTVPDGYAGEKLPVMVWFHGGGFTILTGNTKAFNNTALPSEGVIVVTVNHRLGPFGYLAHPALAAESEHGASGNYGQLDLIAALEWVRDNIEAFGGDPDNVTIFGESGGGGKVLSLLHSPLASGLFHKAIVQSGMGTPEHGGRYPVRWTREENEAEGQRLVEALGLGDTEDLAAALRAVPWVELIETANAIGMESYPGIDGWYMEHGIRDAYEVGQFNDVPVIAGANTGDYPDLREGLVWYMPWMSAAAESDHFAYVFSHVPDGWAQDNVPAYHGIELVYSFGYYDSFFSHYMLGLTEHENPTPEKFFLNPPGVNERDDVVGANMRALWSQFARTGNPSTADIQWPTYTEQSDSYLHIGYDIGAQTGLDTAFPE